jgi:hypothetical protein
MAIFDAFYLMILAVFLTVLGTISAWDFSTIHIRFYQLPLLMSLLVFFISVFKHKIKMNISLCFIFLVFFMLAVALSLKNAMFPLVGLKQAVLLAVFLSFFFLTSNCCTNKQQLLALHKTVIVSALLAVVYGLIMYILTNLPGVEKEGLYHYTRPRSFFAEPNEFGVYLTFVFGYLCAEVFSRVKVVPKMIIYLVLSFAYVLLVPNMSRGTWLGWMVALIVVLWSLHRAGLSVLTPKRFALLIVGICISFNLVLMIVSKLTPTSHDISIAQAVETRVTSLVKANDYTTSIRLKYWKRSLDAMVQHPFLGIGFGNIFTVLEDDAPRKGEGLPELPKVRQATCSNFLLDVGAETGGTGLLIIGLFLFCLCKTAIDKIDRTRDTQLQVIYIGSFASCVGMMVNGLTYPIVMLPFFWIAAGIINTNINSSEIRRRENSF